MAAAPAGSIGIESVAKSPADGYTLLYTPNASIAIVPSLRKVGFDAVKDFDPVARTGDALVGFTVHPSLGIKTFQELVDYAKKNPGKLTYGSSGVGMGNHLKLEAIKNKYGIDILHIPYRGGADTLNDHLPGVIHIMNEPITLAHVQAGKLILLNIDGPVRHPAFPNVPSSEGTRLHRCRDTRSGSRSGRRSVHCERYSREAQREDGRDRQDRRHEGQDARGQRESCPISRRRT